MGTYYIAIERNPDKFGAYQRLWRAHGIEGIMAATMSEGIRKAGEIERSENDKLFFISIVSDEVDFLPQLRVLCEVTAAPVLVAVSKERYAVEEHHAALSQGADFYAAFNDSPDLDISGVFAAVSSVTRRERKRSKPGGIVAHEDILVVADYRKAFVRDAEVTLTAAELKILQYMLLHRGIALSHAQIYGQINGGLYYEKEMTPDAIYNAMKRLRKKLRDAAQADYIETVRNFGYRLRTLKELQ
jgi:DNA-binding response OmpR family regulator